jgi:hypothetical protein
MVVKIRATQPTVLTPKVMIDSWPVDLSRWFLTIWGMRAASMMKLFTS